jgi:hypothetical protein
MTLILEHTPRAPFKVSGTVTVPEIVESKKPSLIIIHLQTVDVDPEPKIWSGKIIISGVLEAIGMNISDMDLPSKQVLNVESIPFDFNLEFEVPSKISDGLYKYSSVIWIEDVLSKIIISGYSEKSIRKI